MSRRSCSGTRVRLGPTERSRGFIESLFDVARDRLGAFPPAIFCPSAVSSLVCSLSNSNCLRAWVVHTVARSDGVIAPATCEQIRITFQSISIETAGRIAMTDSALTTANPDAALRSVKLEWSWVWLLSTSNQRKGSRGGTVPRFRVCGKWRTLSEGCQRDPEVLWRGTAIMQLPISRYLRGIHVMQTCVCAFELSQSG
jgi:hypothetical protein